MILKSLHLQNFRKFSSSEFEFDDSTTILMGENASGKTSIIEAIFLLTTGESFRAGKIDEMIAFESEIGRVSADLIDDDLDIQQVEILLTRGIVQGKRTAKRLYSVNQVKKRKKDAIGKVLSVIFRPEDMRLVEGSPNRRRQFLDTALSIMVKGYAISLSTYEQALLKRNKLLFQVREGEMPVAVLTFWNQQLIKHGQVLSMHRQNFLADFKTVDFPLNFEIEYQTSVISQERVDKYLSREIAAGHTLIGPHKDDFIVKLKALGSKLQKESSKLQAQSSKFQDLSSKLNGASFDVAIYGSRGQQRMAVLWLKFCELILIEKTFDQKAILLLDDILSELDEFSRNKVLSLVGERQTVVSTADKETLKELEERLGKVEIIKL